MQQSWHATKIESCQSTKQCTNNKQDSVESRFLFLISCLDGFESRKMISRILVWSVAPQF